MKHACLLGILFWSATSLQAADTGSRLGQIARESLRQNIVQLPSGPYLAAGANQFHTLWTRDFAFASRGLLAIGREDVVRHHLTSLIQNRRTRDGLVPRVLDSMSTRVRVTLSSLSRLLPLPWQALPLKDPLVPEFVDEHGTEAIDSNALVLLAALDYVARTGDHDWWKANERALLELYHYYDHHRDPLDGLIVQRKYSDWQDSVKREGKAFYTNLLFYVVSSRLLEVEGAGVSAESLDRTRREIEKTFFDETTGLYRSLADLGYLSLDGNLLAIDLGYLTPERAQALYESLKRHELWQGRAGLPGANTVPDYPKEWRHLAAKVSGVGHYHDRLYWSWLMALSAKIARKMGDLNESGRLTARLASLAERDGAIAEVYGAKPDLPVFETCLYRAELPFSWGAAFVLDLVEAR